MSEELNQNETAAETPAEVAPVVETETTPAPEAEIAPQEGAVEEAVATPTQPQVIVQRERGFSHYVGFALLSVLCICFYFMPGIAITFAISLIPGISLGAVAAWTFSALLSVIAWVIFKIKIKGFKKSFFFYIGLCVAVFAILLAIEVLTENYNLFANIFAMLFGAS